MSSLSTRPHFRVVLCQPEIPNNTGNIGRTCVATGCSLDLIKPLGFDTSEKACRRAGLDYWPRLGVKEHDSLDSYLLTVQKPRIWVLTTKTTRSYYEADFQPGDCLIFGRETAGLPAELLSRYSDSCIRMPLVAGERSLNLATAVCAVIFEGIRQLASKNQIAIRGGNICETAEFTEPA